MDDRCEIYVQATSTRRSKPKSSSVLPAPSTTLESGSSATDCAGTCAEFFGGEIANVHFEAARFI